MHAVTVTVTIDQARMEESRQQLESRVIPAVKQAPGLVSGYWLAPQDGKGFSVLLFDSEENAKAAAAMARNAEYPEFVQLDRSDVRAVIGEV